MALLAPCVCNQPRRNECQQRAPLGIVEVLGEENRTCELYQREAANERTLSLLRGGEDDAADVRRTGRSDGR